MRRSAMGRWGWQFAACAGAGETAGDPPTDTIRQFGEPVLSISSIPLFLGSQSLQRHRQQMLHPVSVCAFQSLNGTHGRECFFEEADGGLLCFGHL